MYRTPEDAEDVESGPENHGNSQDDTSLPVDVGLGDGAHAPGGTSELIARERFPIPMEVQTSFSTISCVCRRDVVCTMQTFATEFATILLRLYFYHYCSHYEYYFKVLLRTTTMYYYYNYYYWYHCGGANFAF